MIPGMPTAVAGMAGRIVHVTRARTASCRRKSAGSVLVEQLFYERDCHLVWMLLIPVNAHIRQGGRLE